jgi:hypothetical protein
MWICREDDDYAALKKIKRKLAPAAANTPAEPPSALRKRAAREMRSELFGAIATRVETRASQHPRWQAQRRCYKSITEGLFYYR